MKPVREFLRAHKAVIITTAIFMFGYILYAVWNHVHFQTHAYDLGIFSQGVWHLSKFHAPASTVRDLANIFGEHWDPIVILFAPFSWFVPADWILVIGQAILMSLIVPTIYALSRELRLTEKVSLLLAIGCGLAPGFAPALGYDFHEIAFVVPLFPLFFLFLEQRRWRWFTLVLILLLCTKESLGLYVAAAGFGFVVVQRRRLGIFMMVIGLSVSAVLTTLVLPSLNPGEGFRSWNRYDHLAPSPLGIPKAMINQPKKFISELWNDPAKKNFVNFTILGAGPIILIGFEILPLFILTLLEILWSKYSAEWSFGFHYPLLPAVVGAIGATYGLARLSKIRLWRPFIPMVPIVAIAGAIVVHFLTPSYKSFLNQEINSRPIAEWRNAIKKIPDNAAVSASDSFVPALSKREIIYRYPRIREATWIILDTRAPSFPLSSDAVHLEQKNLLNDPRWTLVYLQNTTMIFHRDDQTFIPDRLDDPATKIDRNS